MTETTGYAGVNNKGIAYMDVGKGREQDAEALPSKQHNEFIKI